MARRFVITKRMMQFLKMDFISRQKNIVSFSKNVYYAIAKHICVYSQCLELRKLFYRKMCNVAMFRTKTIDLLIFI